jgi:hypothetical protein
MDARSDIQGQIIEALTQMVSRPAAENLLRRALRASRGRASELGPRAWAALIEGPLQRELTQVLPVGRLIPPLQNLVHELKSQPRTVEVPTPSAFPTLEITTEYFRLWDRAVRQDLVLELARAEGVTGVILHTPYGSETRLSEPGEGLVVLLASAHRLLALRGAYRVFYTVLGEAQAVLRPLGGSWLAVLARSEANLGHLLYRLGNMEAASEDPNSRRSS